MKNLYTNLIESILNVIFRVIAVTVMTSLLLAIPLAAQKTVNQKGRVREITYSKQENITTIGDVLIKLRNGITKKSYPDGLFDLPVPEYSSFYIEKIDPPDQSRYSLILPSRLELKKPFKYTPNLFEIILSNESKRQKEENRIAKNYQTKYNEEKSSLELQIANLKTALEYSQDESETTRQRLSKQIEGVSK